MGNKKRGGGGGKADKAAQRGGKAAAGKRAARSTKDDDGDDDGDSMPRRAAAVEPDPVVGRKEARRLRAQLKRERQKARYSKDDANCRREFQRLEDQIRPLELAIRDVMGDGNCLFRAVSCALHGNENQHMAIRQATVRFMKQHPDNFAPFVEDDMTFDDVRVTRRAVLHTETLSLARALT